MKKIIAIIGSTASGKSNLAVRIAKKYNAEIISIDSRQIYKRLDETTGKITKEEMDDVPHHMLDLIDPGDKFDVNKFSFFAKEKIDELINSDKNIVLVGGSGFYLDSILYTDTIANVPADMEFRKYAENYNREDLLKEIEEKDKGVIDRIDKNNKRRLVRYLEIIRSLGFLPVRKREKRYNFILIGIKRNRVELRERIEKRMLERWDKMLKEVREELNNGVPKIWFENTGLECRFLSRIVNKELDEEEGKTELLKAIFAYAKRQDTWWGRYENVNWFRENEFKKVFKLLDSIYKI